MSHAIAAAADLNAPPVTLLRLIQAKAGRQK